MILEKDAYIIETTYISVHLKHCLKQEQPNGLFFKIYLVDFISFQT
jgi:hypothetical protein